MDEYPLPVDRENAEFPWRGIRGGSFVPGWGEVRTEEWARSVPVAYPVAGWEVVRPIATGSWAGVYEGRKVSHEEAPDLPDRVALKFLPTGTLTTRQLNHLAEMADRELKLYRSLSHPRLIRFHQTLVVDDPARPELDGAVVIVMELAAGSLADVLIGAAGKPADDAARRIAEICEGLVHMHGNGWVHGDLKPNNVLVMDDGSVRLADFGLAVEMDGTHGYLPPGGSFDYMAPERWEEPLTERGTPIRPSSDIWALGVTAYRLLTGRMPFPGLSPRARMTHAAEYAAGREELVFPEFLSPGWREWLADCLAPDPASRPDAGELLRRARKLAADPSARPAGRAGKRLLLAAAASLALGCGIGGIWLAAGDPRQDAYASWLRPDSDVPVQYREAIVEAAYCKEHVPEVTPALLAASLKVLSDFDPELSDPGKDEYGIARWTPHVLEFYLPPHQKPQAKQLVFDPYVSIRHMGRYLCRLAPEVVDFSEDPVERQLLAATTFQSNTSDMRTMAGIPPYARWYADKVRQYLPQYAPGRL